MKIKNNTNDTFLLNFDKEDFYTGYAQRCIHRIKEEIPNKERKYDWNSHTWTLPQKYINILKSESTEESEDERIEGDRELKRFMVQFEDLPI